MNKTTDEEYRNKLLAMLTGHIGSHNLISMGELYKAVFCEEWHNPVNDTKRLRNLITKMRGEGVAICSSKKRNAGGYYLAAAGSELLDFTRREERRALKILSRLSKIKKVSLPAYLGQLLMDFGNEKNA